MTTNNFDDARLALAQARWEFETRLSLVTADTWDLPTPCDEWTVRDLTAHLIGGATMSRLLLNGASKDEAFEALFSLQIEGDPKVAFAEATDAQAAAFNEPGAADRLCHHPLRDVPGSEFIWMRVRDTLVHAWDLARAINADETLDGELIAVVWPMVEPIAPTLGASGMFGTGTSGSLDATASPQQRLLDALGRRP